MAMLLKFRWYFYGWTTTTATTRLTTIDINTSLQEFWELDNKEQQHSFKLYNDDYLKMNTCDTSVLILWKTMRGQATCGSSTQTRYIHIRVYGSFQDCGSHAKDNTNTKMSNAHTFLSGICHFKQVTSRLALRSPKPRRTNAEVAACWYWHERQGQSAACL